MNANFSDYGNMAGAAHRSFRLVKAGIFSFIVFVIGVVILFSGNMIGFFVIGFAILVLVFPLVSFVKLRKSQKLKEELLSLDIDNDKVSVFFTRINSSKPYNENQRNETENVMVLTDKRIIFVHIPLFSLEEIHSEGILKGLKGLASYDAFDKRVLQKIKSEGLKNIVESSQRAFAINYSEIEKVKLNNVFSHVKFYTGKGNFGYYVLRKDFSKIEEIFKNYIK